VSAPARLLVTDLDVRGKRVFVRVDFNVPLDEKLQVTDDRRIRAAVPTVKWLREHGAVVILASHFGRPKGKVVEEMRLTPCGRKLSEVLGARVTMLGDCVGPQVQRAVKGGRPGDVYLLENLRFHPGEEAGDETFAKELASLCDLYVNDAFGAAHRAHASVSVMTKFVPKAAAGFLMAAEIEHLGGVLENPTRPFVLVFGGAKVSDKIPVLKNLLAKVDAALIGGGMAYTFLASRGVDVGSSRLEPDLVETAGEILREAESRGVKVLLPVDHAIAPKIAEGAPLLHAEGAIPAGQMGLDIGPKTADAYAAAIADARTILWNGPMGVFEVPPFDAGTRQIADAIAKATAAGARSVVGGGDTAAAAEVAAVAGQMTHVSTGGGAALEFLEGVELPGVAALSPRSEEE
jgi:phosphoglycerate kinase